MQVVISTLRGEYSKFDDASWLVPLSESHAPSFQLVSMAVMVNFIQIPRLVNLVRLCHTRPAKATEAASLAKRLYQNNCQPWMDHILQNEINVSLTSSVRVLPFVQESYHFNSVHGFELVTRYFASRILLCGIIQTLGTIAPLASVFDISSVENEDLKVAKGVAMSVEYALNSNESLPFTALHIVKILKITFGAWQRLEKRQARREECEFACGMKDWCLDVTNHILKMWNCPLETKHQLELLAGAMVGNTVPSFLVRRVDPSLILTSQDSAVL